MAGRALEDSEEKLAQPLSPPEKSQEAAAEPQAHELRAGRGACRGRAGCGLAAGRRVRPGTVTHLQIPLTCPQPSPVSHSSKTQQQESERGRDTMRRQTQHAQQHSQGPQQTTTQTTLVEMRADLPQMTAQGSSSAPGQRDPHPSGTL